MVIQLGDHADALMYTYKTTVNLYTIYTLIYIDRCSVKYLYCSICVEWNGIETVIMFI